MPNPEVQSEVVASYSVGCEGVAVGKVVPLIDNPAQPNITIYRDGSREIGCPYLDPLRGSCRAIELLSNTGTPNNIERLRCIRLFPTSSKQDFTRRLEVVGSMPTLNS